MNGNQTHAECGCPNTPLGSSYCPEQPQQPQPQPSPPETGCCGQSRRNRPQSDCVGTAALLLITGGMSISRDSGFSLFSDLISPTYMRVCWFSAAIIGALVGAALASKTPKKLFLLVSSLLIALGGILLLAFPTDSVAIMIARHLNGFAVGLAFVPTLVMGGEVVVARMRGRIASSAESMAFAVGAFVQIELAAFWSHTTISLNQIHGLVCVCLSAIALLYAHFKVVESPVYLLLRGKECEAVECLRRLQRPRVLTTETYEQLEEHKLYIAANQEKKLTESVVESLPALAKLSLLRGIVGLNFSLIANIALIIVTLYLPALYATVPFLLYGMTRWIGGLVGIFLMDSVGRKSPLVCCTLICGAAAIALGFSYPHADRLASVMQLRSVLVLLLVHQFCAGLAATSSSAYLSEAFPMTVKPYCIAATFAVEMIVHVIIASVQLGPFSVAEYFYTLGSLSFLFAGFVAICFPETKNTTLRQAQNKFQGFLSK